MIFNVFLAASINTRTNITLPRMIPNDNYANPQELEIYDSIMTLKDLRLPVAIEYNNQSPVSPMTPGSDAPLLPPRNNEPMETPPPLRTRRHLQPLTLKEEDDYISMSSNVIISNGTGRGSPRYTETPGLSSFPPLQPQDGVYAIPGPSVARLPQSGRN